MMNSSPTPRVASRRSSTCSSDDEINSETIREAIHDELRNEQMTEEDEDFQPLGREFDLKALLADGSEVLRLLCHQQVERAIELCDARKGRSFLHAFGRAHIKFLLSTNLEKESLVDAFDAYNYAIRFANAIRKRSWANHLGLTQIPLFRPNYDKYTDEEILAELMYGLGHGPAGCLNFFLKGKTSSALLSSTWYGNRYYRSYWECEYILKHRTNWENADVKENFESVLHYIRGCYSMGLEFAPKFVRKFMNIFGFVVPNINGIEEIEIAAKCKDGIVFPLAVITLLAQSAIFQPFMGSGNQPNFEGLHEVLEIFTEDTYGGLNKLIMGIFELLRGNVELSIDYQRQAFPTLRRIGKTYLVCYALNIVNHDFLCEWENALKFLNTTKKERKLTKLYASGIAFLHAAHLMMIREDKAARGIHEPELDEVIKAALREASEFRGIFVLKRIKELFIVPMVVSRAKRFQGDLDSFVSPLYETFYVLNAFTLMDRKPKLLNPFLERTLVRLNAVSNNESPEYWNSYAYLLFYKALFLRHLGRLKEASNCFREIISIESNITYYEELIPHSYYEMGLVCRSNGEYLEAKKWLDTADERRNYYTRELMRHRIANALESIKPHIDCED